VLFGCCGQDRGLLSQLFVEVVDLHPFCFGVTMMAAMKDSMEDLTACGFMYEQADRLRM